MVKPKEMTLKAGNVVTLSLIETLLLLSRARREQISLKTKILLKLCCGRSKDPILVPLPLLESRVIEILVLRRKAIRRRNPGEDKTSEILR